MLIQLRSKHELHLCTLKISRLDTVIRLTSIVKNASVDFQEIYRDLLDGEKSESEEDLKISPPEICTNSSQMRNDSAFNASGEDIFTSQDKEYLLLEEEIQIVALVKN